VNIYIYVTSLVFTSGGSFISQNFSEVVAPQEEEEEEEEGSFINLLVITLVGLPVLKLSADEMALVLLRHGEEFLIGKRQVQEENLMFSNNPVSVWDGLASLIDD
jgi:hypothetical protein